MRARRIGRGLGITALLAVALAAGTAPSADGGARKSKSPPIDPAVRQQAIVDLSSPDEDARDAAIARLIGWKTPDLIEPATAALNSVDVNVRFGAIRVLGACGGPKAAKTIAEAMRTDREARIRREASHALLESAQPKIAVPAWTKAARSDGDPGVRRAAILDLGRTSEPDAFDELVELYAEAVELDDANVVKWTTNAMTLLCGEKQDDNLEAWRHAAAQFRERIEAAEDPTDAESTDDADADGVPDPTVDPASSADPEPADEPEPEPSADPDPAHSVDRDGSRRITTNRGAPSTNAVGWVVTGPLGVVPDHARIITRFINRCPSPPS